MTCRKLTPTTLKALPVSKSGGSKIFDWDAEVPGFGAYRTSRGRVTFVYQYRMRGGGKPQRLTIGVLGVLTAQDARDMAREHAVNVVRGIDPRAAEKVRLAETEQDKALTLDAFWPVFLELRRADDAPVDRSLINAMTKDILPRLGSKHMERMTVKEVDEVKLELTRRSAGAWRRAIEALKLVLNRARKAELIERVVTDKIATPKSGRRDRAFKRTELVIYLAALADVGGARGDALLVLLLLCRRMNEVGDMTWEEIDQHEWTWTMPASRAKNGKPLFLRLPRQVIRILEQQEPNRYRRTGRVFVHDYTQATTVGLDAAKRGVGLVDPALLPTDRLVPRAIHPALIARVTEALKRIIATDEHRPWRRVELLDELAKVERFGQISQGIFDRARKPLVARYPQLGRAGRVPSQN